MDVWIDVVYCMYGWMDVVCMYLCSMDVWMYGWK